MPFTPLTHVALEAASSLPCSSPISSASSSPLSSAPPSRPSSPRLLPPPSEPRVSADPEAASSLLCSPPASSVNSSPLSSASSSPLSSAPPSRPSSPHLPPPPPEPRAPAQARETRRNTAQAPALPASRPPQPAHSYRTRFSLRMVEEHYPKASGTPGAKADEYGIHPSEADFAAFDEEGEEAPAAHSSLPAEAAEAGPSKAPASAPGLKAGTGWQRVPYRPISVTGRADTSQGAPASALGKRRRDPSPEAKQHGAGTAERQALADEGSGHNPGKRRRGRKAPRKRERGGQALAAAGGNTRVAKVARLRDKNLRRSEHCQNSGFSVAEDALCAGTGWHGAQLTPAARKKLAGDYDSGAIGETVARFFPIAYNEAEGRPVRLLDEDGRTFGYRSAVLEFIKEEAGPLVEAVEKLLKKHLASKRLRKKFKEGARGPHFACIIGHYRAYSRRPGLTGLHRRNKSDADAFANTRAVQKVTEAVSSAVHLMFPGVAKRLEISANWYRDNHGIGPQFGLFWNLCINGIFPGQKRVHSRPHADYKNIVGVCGLLVYEIPGKGRLFLHALDPWHSRRRTVKFNHAKRTWLVLWEAGVVVQLPPWVICLYPSSLLTHFNIDIHDIRFVTTSGEERPTPANSTPLTEGDDEGRGSFVYFNQAAMFQSSETGHATLKEARRAGKETKVDWAEVVEAAFTRHGKFIPVDH